MYSESHCHLGAITREAVEKAEADGFRLLLTAGIDLGSSEEAAKMARKYSIVKGCVGVHPWYADEYDGETGVRLRELARGPEVVAVSEIGLDFVGRMTKEWVREERYIDRSVQYRTFKAQLGLAYELGLPAIIHDRAPGQEILDTLLRSENLSTGLAIHGFNKDAEYAVRCVDNGVYLSVGLRAVQSADESFVKAVEAIPLEYMLTETDSGTPQGILTVCDLVGKIKGHTSSEVGEAATRNLMRLCRL